MKLDVLPTIEDLLGDYQWIRVALRKHPDKEPNVSEITNTLVRKVEELWTQASVPTVPIERIIQQVQCHHDPYLKLILYPACKMPAIRRLQILGKMQKDPPGQFFVQELRSRRTSAQGKKRFRRKKDSS